MIILLTDPKEREREGEQLNNMLAAHSGLIVHLRKPEMERAAYELALKAIDPAFHGRIVLHQHHELSSGYAVKGVHFTERHRSEQMLHPKVVSTSFHTLADAQEAGMNYDYFFCSPVFPSVSKQGYAPLENWHIADRPEAFREKAVALGGVQFSTLAAARERGFRHVAVLGAVWEAIDPVTVLAGLYRAM